MKVFIISVRTVFVTGRLAALAYAKHFGCAAFAALSADFTAAVAVQKSVAGGIAALIFHCAAAVADGAGFISFGIGFFQSIVITVARIALAF